MPQEDRRVLRRSSSSRSSNSSSNSSNSGEAGPSIRPQGRGLPLLQGLQALAGGAQALIGWVVVAQGKQQRQFKLVGTVDQVASVQPAGRGAPLYHLLRVVQDSVLQPYGFQGTEVHTLPLVPDIVAALHPQQQLIVITPPEGLLELGQRELLLAFLSQELPKYAQVAPAGAAATDMQPPGARPLTQVRVMPTRASLLAAGRQDLVNLILRVGGFTQAALQLGMRSSRRPAGYWDSLEVLDAELDQFIAGCWVALPCVDADEADASPAAAGAQQADPTEPERYFYNLATRAIRWTMPDAALQAAAPAADGGAEAGGPLAHEVPQGPLAGAVMDREVQAALLELQGERVLPSRSTLQSAGRWDLHHAIQSHGGYAAVAAALGRRTCRGIPLQLLTPQALKTALLDLARGEGWPTDRLPSLRQLQEADRPELGRAIAHFGGWRMTAELLSLHCSRPASSRGAGRDPELSLEQLAAQLRHFMDTHEPAAAAAAAAAADGGSSGPPTTLPAAHEAAAAGSGSGPGRGGGSSRLAALREQRGSARQTRMGSQGAVQPQQQQQPGVSAQGRWQTLPTHAQLRAAGRTDLVYWMRQHGSEAVQLHVGLPGRHSKAHKPGVLQWELVEAAVAAGCHTCRGILSHITHQHEQEQQQEQLHVASTQQQSPSSTQQQRQQQHPGPKSAGVPLVRREHLSRALRAWCVEGRLVKTGRNTYHLPGGQQQ